MASARRSADLSQASPGCGTSRSEGTPRPPGQERWEWLMRGGRETCEARRTYVVRLSPELHALVDAVCLDRHRSVSTLIRTGIAMLQTSRVDTECLPEMVEEIDAAGKLLNSAAHDMNACALRFSVARRLTADDRRRLVALVDSCADSGRNAGGMLSRARLVARQLPGCDCVLSDEPIEMGEARFYSVVGVRLNDSERRALSTLSCPQARSSSQVARLAISVACRRTAGAHAVIVAGPRLVSNLNRSIVRWTTNANQIRSSASSVLRAQSDSRYLTYEESAALRTKVEEAVGATQAAYGALAMLIAQMDELLSQACEERGLVLVPAVMVGE